MEYVSIVRNEEASSDTHKRYNIMQYKTNMILKYSVKQEELALVLKNNNYVVKDGAEYVADKALDESDKDNYAEEMPNHIMFTLGGKIVFGLVIANACGLIMFLATQCGLSKVGSTLLVIGCVCMIAIYIHALAVSIVVKRRYNQAKHKSKA